MSVKDVLINTRHLPEQVREYIGRHNESDAVPLFVDAYEQTLQGSAVRWRSTNGRKRRQGFCAECDRSCQSF